MKKINKFGAVLFLIILGILIIKDVNALGISPGRTTINFEPNLEKDITLTVFNSENKDFTATIFTRGELRNYVELEQTELKFSSEESQKSFNYKIKLPEKIEKPGSHRVEIVVRQISKTKEGEDIVIGALVAVVSQLDVKVPFPGKYAVAHLDILGAKENEEVKFFIRVTNLGEEDIEKAKATILIYDSSNKEVAKIESDEKAIKTKNRKELKATWKANVLGSYRAVALVNYDGLLTKVEGSFRVGDFLLKPLDISVKNFRLGQIAKFNILVENSANREIKDAVAQLLLFDENENKIMDIKSGPTEIEALSKKELLAYWDTEGVKEGTYIGKLILTYEDNSYERQIRTAVTENSIKTEIIGITAFAIAAPETESKKVPVLMLIMIILILSNIAWFIYLKNFKKSKGETKYTKIKKLEGKKEVEKAEVKLEGKKLAEEAKEKLDGEIVKKELEDLDKEKRLR
ncbi:MAG: hypothetical protein IH934_03410 [Nanoarchaeota archaeon]|nr:hypothetical protein [Nanoarchaeota archaeon]